MTDSIKPAISPEHQWHGVLTNDYGAEIEAFGDLGVDPDEDGTRWAYPPVQYTRTELVDPAADRIEQLVKSLAFSQKMDAKCVDDVFELEGKLEAAEAKLAKAYDIIARIVAIAPDGDEYDDEWHMTYDAAKNFLDELEKTE